MADSVSPGEAFRAKFQARLAAKNKERDARRRGSSDPLFLESVRNEQFFLNHTLLPSFLAARTEPSPVIEKAVQDVAYVIVACGIRGESETPDPQNIMQAIEIAIQTDGNMSEIAKIFGRHELPALYFDNAVGRCV